MKINVEIIDEITQYEFDGNSIIVGKDDSCDLNLNYEEIGPKHIKIYKDLGKFYLEDLSSGEETLLNGMIIAPGSTRELTSLFPVEIGGLLIHLVDEDESDVDSFFEADELTDNATAATQVKNETKVLEKKKIKNIDPSKVSYLFILVFIVGSVWNFYSKRINLNTITVSEKKKVVKKPFEIEIDYNSRLKPFREVYIAVLEGENCDESCIKNLSLPVSLKGSYGKIIDETLYIGIDSNTLKKDQEHFYKMAKLDSYDLETLVNKQYNVYFNYQEFVSNNNIAPFNPFVVSYNVYQNIISLYMQFITKQINSFGPDFNRLHIFSYDKEEGYIKVTDYIEFEAESMAYVDHSRENDIKELYLYSKHKLTEGMENLFKSRFNSSQDDYISTERDHFNNEIFQISINKSIQNLKCSENNDLCLKLRASGEFGQHEGVQINKNLLIVAWDFNFKKDELIKEYTDYEYNKIELKIANLEYSKASNQQNYKDFREQNFKYIVNHKNYIDENYKHFNESRLAIEFLESEILPFVFKKGEFKQILLLGKESEEVKFGCFLSVSELSLRDRKRIDLYKKILWRSYIPVMDGFINSKCKPLKEF